MRLRRVLLIAICTLIANAGCAEGSSGLDWDVPDAPALGGQSTDAPIPAAQTPEAQVPEAQAPGAQTMIGGSPNDAVTARAVAAAQAAGAARGAYTAVALFDRHTGALYGAGDIDEPYASASVMKVFIAARLLAEGRAADPMVGDLMWRMITLSDDDAATRLYQLVGAEDLVPWIARRYGVTGLAPSDQPGWWGLTRISARAMVTFYAAVAADPVVAPWLMEAMASTEPYASDGFYQYFGLPAAAENWRVKQGWMCCLEGLSRMHSTGYIDYDRYTVALLAAGPPSMYHEGDGAHALTAMARALLPDGTVPKSV